MEHEESSGGNGAAHLSVDRAGRTVLVAGEHQHAGRIRLAAGLSRRVRQYRHRPGHPHRGRPHRHRLSGGDVHRAGGAHQAVGEDASAIDKDAPVRFLRTAFHPDDWVAVFLKSHDTGGTTQRVGPLSLICHPKFQAWLRAQNARRFSVYVSINAIRPQRRARTRDAIGEIRHVFLDADRDGDGVLQSIGARRDLPLPSYVIRSSPGRLHVLWQVTGFTKEDVEGAPEAARRRTWDGQGGDLVLAAHGTHRLPKPQVHTGVRGDGQLRRHRSRSRASRVLGKDRPGRLLVVDPFAGGGVIPLAATLRKHWTYAQDLNPWAAAGLVGMLDLPNAKDLAKARDSLSILLGPILVEAYATTFSDGSNASVSHTFRVLADMTCLTVQDVTPGQAIRSAG